MKERDMPLDNLAMPPKNTNEWIVIYPLDKGNLIDNTPPVWTGLEHKGSGHHWTTIVQRRV